MALEYGHVLKLLTYISFGVSLLTLTLIHILCPPRFKRNGSYLLNKFSQNNYKDCELESILKRNQDTGCTSLISPCSDYTIMTPDEEFAPCRLNKKNDIDYSLVYQQNSSMATKPIVREQNSSLSTSNNNNHKSHDLTRGSASYQFINIGRQEISRFSASSKSFGGPSVDTPPALKRCSSSQELAVENKPEVSLLNSYKSLPNVNADDQSIYPFLPLAEQCTKDDAEIGSTDTDRGNEGTIQCAITYKRNRHIQLSGLALQTILPPESPGFVIEISLVPKETEAIRSKVYLTDIRSVDESLNESFMLSCNDSDIDACSIVITVKPLLGNIIFYAETELKGLDLLIKAEVYLTGYLKGVKTYTLPIH